MKKSCQVFLEDVAFWRCPEQLQEKEAMKMYPPRFQVTVNGREATRTVNMRFTFTGTDRPLCSEYILQLTALQGRSG